MKKSEGFLPCPFCGSEWTIGLSSFKYHPHPLKHAVFCAACSTQGPPGDTSALAIQGWNTRNTPKNFNGSPAHKEYNNDQA